MEPVTELDPRTARSTRSLRHMTKDNVDMSQFPLEEASRTVAVGRKRKQPQELWAAHEAPPAYIDKRQRLEENDDYVPLVNDLDDSSKSTSSNGSSSRRASKESGEISTSATGSRRASNESANSAFDLPVTRSKTKAAAVNPRVTPIDDELEIVGARDCRPTRTVYDVRPKTLRAFIAERAKSNPSASIESLVRECCESGMPHRWQALEMMSKWNLAAGTAATVSTLAAPEPTASSLASDPAASVVEKLSQGGYTREMSWEDVPEAEFPVLSKAARNLVSSGSKGSVLEALLHIVSKGPMSKQARTCVGRYASVAAVGSLRDGSKQPGTSATKDEAVAGLASNAFLEPRRPKASKHGADPTVLSSATWPNGYGRGGTVEDLATLYASQDNFSRPIQYEDIWAKQLQPLIGSMRSSQPTASVADLLVETAKTGENSNRKLANSVLRQFARKYCISSSGGLTARGNGNDVAGGGGVVVNTTQVYVSNLPSEFPDVQMQRLFKGYKMKSATMYTEQRNGGVGGYALVTLATPPDAARAVRKLNGKMFLGRKMSVQHAIADVEDSAKSQLARTATITGHAPCKTEQVDGPDSEGQIEEASRMDVSDDGSDEASVGDVPDGSANDYGKLARNAASARDNGHFTPATMVRLFEITEQDQQLQYRYFGISDPAAHVRCLSCGEEGHMEDECPARTCKHCGALDQHFSAACPAFLKCGRCRQRGHDTRTCTNRSVEAGGFGDLCDVCGGSGHVEEECSGLWRTFKPDDSDTAARIPARDMRCACYNCGDKGHWGDDCDNLPTFMRRRLGNNKTWSAAYASRFVREEQKGYGVYGGHGGQGGYGGGGGGSYQLAAFDGMRD